MNKLNKLLVAIMALGTLNSCKDFGDVNVDPYNSTAMDASLLLSQTQLRFSGDVEVAERLNLGLTMSLTQQVGGLWLNRYGQMYIHDRGYMTIPWSNIYRNEIVNIVDAVERSKGDPYQQNLNAICRIMKVYEFARLTDVYGDIPYKEAGRAYSAAIVRPVYDKQQDIYNDFFIELKEASEQLDASKDAVKGDFIYNGNINAWKKFANSLRLRYAMRLVKVDPNKAKQEAEAAYNAGVFTSNADIALMKHIDIQSTETDYRGNGTSAGFTRQEAGTTPRVQTTFLNQLLTTNDPRVKYMIKYYQDKNNDHFNRIDLTDAMVAEIGYKGVDPDKYVWDDWRSTITLVIPGIGKVAAGNNDQIAQLANYMIRFNAPFLHQTYAEVEFLLAEATVRWGANFGGSALDHYENGVRAACAQLSLFPGGPTIPDAEITTFLNNNSLIPGREVELINTQLWIALLLNGPESFANWRRTGYPKLLPAFMAESTETVVPRRHEYPELEVEQNSANVNVAISNLGAGGNKWTNRVWWDKP